MSAEAEEWENFRTCVLLVFEWLGMPNVPEAYLDDLIRLNEAAGEWHSLHAERYGFLEFDLPDLVRSSGVVTTGNLPEAERLGWTRNEAARHFVRYIDERSGRRGTLLMLQVIMLIQQLASLLPPVNAAGGKS